MYIGIKRKMAVSFSRPLHALGDEPPAAEQGPPAGAREEFAEALAQMKAYEGHADRKIARRFRIERLKLEWFLERAQVVVKPMRVPGTLEIVPGAYVSNFGGVYRQGYGGKWSWVKVDRKDGRRKIQVNGKVERLSRVIHVSFFPEKGPLIGDLTVDHANDIRSDDRAINLKERMTHGENSRRMRLSGLAKSSAPAMSKAIVGRPADAADDVPWERFSSQTEAARRLTQRLGVKVDDGSISNVVRGKRRTYKGWIFCAAEDPDLDGEEWVDDPHYYDLDMEKTVLEGARGSSLGRWQNAHGGMKLFPSIPDDKDGYAVVQWQRKTYSLHRLLLSTFHGPPPGPNHVVDHIDGNKANNAVANLRWATYSENNLNENNADRKTKRARVN